MANPIPSETIDTFARSIFKEASNYGFSRVDLIRLINELMALCTAVEGSVQNLPDANRPGGISVADGPVSLPVSGERIEIREFGGSEDVRLLEKWLPDRYGRYFVVSSATAQSVTVDSLISNPDNHLGMITLRDGTPIGAMAYLDHSKEQKRAELRKLIGELECRGKGFAEEATRLWVRYGISALGLEKIYVSTLQTQINNIKLNESIGFRVEGLLRNEVLVDDKRHDVLRMGLWIE
jgi:RimJ/RimL family protein N-acetyltransferase